MRKAIAIYHAPEGDSKVVEMGGVTFFDGQTVDLNSDDHGHLIDKLQNNQHFEFELGEEEVSAKPKRGRTRNVDTSAAQAEANDHDFEQDRRDGLTRKPVEANDEVKN